MSYQESMNKFSQIVSMVESEHVAALLRAWAIKNIREYRVQTTIDREGELAGMLKYEQERALEAMVKGAVKASSTEEIKDWMQGQFKFGKTITRTVAIVGSHPGQRS